MLAFVKKQRIKGSISIYLSIIFLSIVLLVSVIGESARVAGVYAKAKSVTHMAADSVLAGYARQVYDDYGILLVWNRAGVKSTLDQYIQANINMADMQVAGYDLMKMDVGEINVSKQTTCTDKGGDEFVKQICSYLKFAGMTKAIKKIMNDSKNIKEEDSSNNISDEYDDDVDEIEILADAIDSKIKDLSSNKKVRDYNTELAELMGKKNYSISKGKKIAMKLKEEIGDMQADIDDALEIIKDYTGVRDSVLKRHNQKPVRDSVDDNKLLLEQISNNISIMDTVDLEDESDKTKIKKYLKVYVEKSGEITRQLKMLKTSDVTKKDKENNNLFEDIKELLNKGVLSLVVSDQSGWSDNTVEATDLPSLNNKTKSKDSEITDKAAIALYAYNYFGNYLEPNKKDALQYGLEYIVAGEDSDQDNLAQVVEELVAVRHIPNMACLLKDEAKMGIIRAIAASVAAVTHLPFLEPIAKALLIEAWTLAESVCDVRILLKGKKISLIKKSSNWRTSLTNLFPKDENGDSEGLKYIGYLEGLMMLLSRETMVYRTMDLIQMNVCKKYNSSFRMKDALLCFNGEVSFETAPLLAGMPWMVSMLGNHNGGFEFKVGVSNQYIE